MAANVTQRKQAEDLRAAQARMLKLAIEDRALSDSLDELVRVVETQSTDGVLASVLLLDEEGRHLRHGAAPSLPNAYNEAVDGIAAGPLVGSCGAAAHGKAAVFVEDVATSPLWADFRDLALSNGLRACWSAPIFSSQGRVLGTFAMYYRQPRLPAGADLALVELVANSAALVIEHKHTVAALRQSEARFRGVFDAKLAGLTVFDATTGKTLAINDAFLAMTGHSRKDFDKGAWDWREFTIPEYLPLDEAAIAQARERGWWEPYEKEYRRRDGRRFPVRIASAPLPGAPGQVVVSIQDISEGRAAEADLRESEARFRNMADNAPVMMWVTDASGYCTHLNQPWYAYTGQASQAGEGFGWLDAVHPDDRPIAQQAFVSANAHHQAYRIEFRLRRADGAYRWVIDAASPRFGADGEFLGYVGSVIDIDDRREIEAALRTSEERLRLATESAAIGTWDFDLVTGALRWDERCKALFGLSPAAAVDYDTFLAGLHPDHRALSHAAVQQTLAPEGSADFAMEYRTVGLEDGVERWLASRGRAFFHGPDDARRAYRFVGTVIDITAAKRSEEVLERRVAEALLEKKLLADIVEGTDAFVQVVDLGFHWMAVNRAAADEFERIYGVRPRVGASMLDALADKPDHQEAVRAVWARALAGEEFTEVGEFGDPGRDRRFYEMKYNVLRNAAGERVGAYQFVYDVTQRIAEQRRLQDAEEQLRQSQKMEAMGQLTGGVAHDFNNLLTPIIGSLDLLVRRGLGNERERRLIDGALQSADRAKVLVQRLLAFARRQPLQPVSVDVCALIKNMAGLIGSTLGPRIDIELLLADDLPPARADTNQLEMALLNLAVNARDAMPDGGVLTIAANKHSVQTGDRTTLRPGDYVRLCVADAGVGMDEETRRRAVEPFFSTKGIGKGTGLGLSMVHGLLAQLDGKLAIKSAPGRGTTIELWLPISPAPLGVEDVATPKAMGRRGQGKALLVDDEELVRMSTADMLMDMGFEVVEAGSAEEALRLVRAGTVPDLLVTDHLMPGMSGVDLVRELREQRPKLPVLIVSGYAEAEGIAPDLPRLTKPFRNAELADTVRDVMQG